MFAWLETGPYPVRLGFVDSEDDQKVFIKEHDLDPKSVDWPAAGDARAMWWKGPTMPTTYLISINTAPIYSWAHVISALAHEITHIMQFLWRDIEETEVGTEAEAYMVQWLMKQLLDIMNPKGIAA